MSAAATLRPLSSCPAPRGSLDRPAAPCLWRVVRLVDAAQLAALQAEAWAGAARATPWVSGEALRDDDPFVSIDQTLGGPAVTALRDSPATLAALAAHTGARWRPLFPRPPQLLYYRRPTHFMSLHRDSPSCDLTVVTCLIDTPGEGGELVLFPDRGDEPLDALRATPDQGAVTLRLRPGDSLLMFGREVPHAVTPPAPGRMRVTASYFYRRVDAAA